MTTTTRYRVHLTTVPGQLHVAVTHQTGGHGNTCEVQISPPTGRVVFAVLSAQELDSFINSLQAARRYLG